MHIPGTLETNAMFFPNNQTIYMRSYVFNEPYDVYKKR